jgi:uncharacterized membrane protein (DUF373 family)
MEGEMMNDMAASSPTPLKIFFMDSEWHSKVIKFLVSLVMLTIYAWIIAGVATLFKELYHTALSAWIHGAEAMIKDVVIILASLELIRTLQSYLKLGRVKITFILDAALVVLIGELMSLWLHSYTIPEVMITIGVISFLTILRVLMVRFSPRF